MMPCFNVTLLMALYFVKLFLAYLNFYNFHFKFIPIKNNMVDTIRFTTELTGF